MKTRLFIGNLPSTVAEEELRDKFSALLSSHKGEAEVGNVEVRCKNEDNYFGYVDVHINSSNQDRKSLEGSSVQAGGHNNGIPVFLRKYIDLMNNTKWKGSLIKVQLAKESFIEKLKREQQENRKLDQNQTGQTDASFHHNGRISAQGENSEVSRNQKQAHDILQQLNRSKERRNRSNKFQQDNISEKVDCGFEVVSNEIATERSRKHAVETSSPSKKQQKRPSRKSESSSSSEDESDDNVRDGIPKFKGLLSCYPGEKASKPAEKEATVVEDTIQAEMLIQQKLLTLAFDKNNSIPQASNSPSKISVVNFKKNKQQQSDLLRLQSLEKLKELKAQRKSLVSSALSSVTASAPLTEQRKILESDDYREGDASSRKKSKMTLFDDDDEGDNEPDEGADGDVFQVKKQYEGAGGQKLLELKTRWGNDDRFKIDDRFKESDAEEDAVEPIELEKEKQMDILTGILGKDVSTKTRQPPGTQKKAVSTKDPLSLSSVIMPRYDPELDDENQNLPKDQVKDEEDEKSSKRNKENAKNTDTTEGTEKIVRSTEPATFKTVSNLKALFSSTGDVDSTKGSSTAKLFKAPTVTQESGTFSLLASFGKTSEGPSEQTSTSKSSSGPVEGPRTFWQSNPFRYDSSDDEDEKGDNVKVTIQNKPEKSSISLVVHGKAPFFFTENDPRFEGLEDFFLRYEDNSNVNGEVASDGSEIKKEPTEDFSLKRQELKSIVKAKIRNTRRKDEKRTLAIKRAIRKRKRKLQHRNKSF